MEIDRSDNQAGQISDWISAELLAETQQVWSEVYDREVSAAEATEILLNVKRLASAVVKSLKDQ